MLVMKRHAVVEWLWLTTKGSWLAIWENVVAISMESINDRLGRRKRSGGYGWGGVRWASSGGSR